MRFNGGVTVMLRCVKNKLYNSLLTLLGIFAFSFPVSAGIVLEFGVGVSPVVTDKTRMSTIILAPDLGPQREGAYALQRGLAWRMYRQGNDSSGAMLVVPPALGGVGDPSSIRQMSLRSNMARANAYRLNYFKR